MAEERPHKFLLWLVAIGFFMQTLDSTIVNTALPTMAHDLGESPLRMQSVVIAYALTMAMLIPASGWIADRFGTRRAFFCAILLFMTGSLLCALSHSVAQLVIARVIQGAGGALLLPVGRLSVLRSVPRGEFLQAMAFVAVPGMVGPLIGPTLGGWLVEAASWHWIFLINIPIGIAGSIATLAWMPDSRAETRTRFDLPGYLLIAVGLVAVSLALDGLSELGMRHAAVLVLLAFGFASLTAYWLHASQRPDPLFSPRLFTVHSFSIGLLGNLFARIGSGSMPFLIPLLLQVSLGYSPSQAGLMMVPVAAAAILCKPLVTPLILRAGYRRVLVANTLVVGVSIASFALFHPEGPWWLRVIQLAIFGAANSLQFTAMNTITLKDLDTAGASGGNSLLSMVQMLSMSLGVAAAGALLATFTAMSGQGSPAQMLPAFHATFVAVGLITCASAWIFWQLSPDIKPGSKPVEPSEMA